MEATYELITAARGVMQGNSDSFWRLYEKTLDDVYFQLHFTMASEQDINPQLENVYVSLARSFTTLEKPEQVVNWINDIVIQQLDTWLEKNRPEMMKAERKGDYAAPVYQDLYIPALEADEQVYTKAMMEFLYNMPELYRSVLVAVYYDGYSSEEIADKLMVEKHVITRRMEYIEKTLAVQMQDFCKKNNIAKKTVTTQRICNALYELQKLYRYPYAEALYNNIRIKAIH